MDHSRLMYNAVVFSVVTPVLLFSKHGKGLTLATLNKKALWRYSATVHETVETIESIAAQLLNKIDDALLLKIKMYLLWIGYLL